MTLEWTFHPSPRGGRKSWWTAPSPLGEISIRQRLYPNHAYGWELSFPNKMAYRAETVDAAKAYADNWATRAPMPDM